MMTGGLQNWVAKNGYADSILFYGTKNAKRIEASLTFASNTEELSYDFVLAHAAGGILVFYDERITHRDIVNKADVPQISVFNSGVRESAVFAKSGKTNEDQTAFELSKLLKSCRVFQFHNTSATAHIRNPSYIVDGHELKNDGGNLSAFLYNLQENYSKHFDRIVRHLSTIIPQFKSFVLRPSVANNRYISLDWLSYQYDYLLGPHKISCGSIRFMCLTALLLQPEELMPSVIIIDEPELGLHPAAIAKLSGMIKIASRHAQIILATQSPNLINEFDLEDLIVVERNPEDGSSTYVRHDPERLEKWLDEYSLGELWEKNVIGGQPV